MKRAYGALFVGVLVLFAMASPVAANVTWGDLTGNTLAWYEKTDTLGTYSWGLNLKSPNEEYYALGPINDYSTDFDIIQANDTFIYTIQGSDYTFYPLDDHVPQVEVFLLLLPVQINGSSYFDYLFAEKSSLKYLTNATITATSIVNDRAIMEGIHTEADGTFDVSYTWSTTSGLLLQKKVTGAGGGELLIVPGMPPKDKFNLTLPFLFGALLVVTLVSWWFTRMAYKKREKDDFGLDTLALVLSTILSLILSVASIYTLLFLILVRTGSIV